MWRASSSCNKYKQNHGETKQLCCDGPIPASQPPWIRSEHNPERPRSLEGYGLNRRTGAASCSPRPPSGSRLQIGLEVAVIAYFLVYLQTVSLTVRDDNTVGRRIEFYRRREAETVLRLEALYPAPSLRHVGIGIDGLLAPLR